jgi:hypothetical protein
MLNVKQTTAIFSIFYKEDIFNKIFLFFTKEVN